MDVSFGTMWEAIARELPDAVAISEPGRDYTFAEFDDRAARLATALAAAGVGPGDKVACYLSNHSPLSAPVVEPTIRTGVAALTTAARAWLGAVG